METVTGTGQPAITPIAMAMICHAVNRAYAGAFGDTSLVSWEESPDQQKQSVMDGVLLYLNVPTAGAHDAHARWIERKLEEGWQRGNVLDRARKLHPCLVPWVDLPPEQQAKGIIFREIVLQLMPFMMPVGIDPSAGLPVADEAVAGQGEQDH